MRNVVHQPTSGADVLQWTNGTGSDVAAGDVVALAGGGFAVAHGNIADGATGTVWKAGRYRLAKATGGGTAVVQGEVVGFNTSTQVVTKSPTAASIAFGRVAVAAGDSAAEVEVDLEPIRVPAAS